MVHYKQRTVKVLNRVEMAAEEVRLCVGRVVYCLVTSPWSEPKLKAEAQLHRRLPVGLDVGLRRVVGVFVEVIDDCPNQRTTGFILAGFGVWVGGKVSGAD